MVEYNWEDDSKNTPAQAPEYPADWGQISTGGADVGSRLRGRSVPVGEPVYPGSIQEKEDIKLVGEPSAINTAKILAERAANAATLNAARHVYTAPEQINSQNSYWENIEEQKKREAALSRQSPVTSAVGTGLGTVATLGSGPLISRVVPAAEGFKGLAQTAAIAGTGSGIASYLDEPDIQLAAFNALGGAAMAPVFQAGIRAVSNKLKKVPEPLDANGNFTPDAQAIINMEFPNLNQQQRDLFRSELADTFRQKGANISSAKEAVIKYAGGERPTQSQTSGVISSEMKINPEVVAAQNLTKEQIADKLRQGQSLRPQTPDTVAANIFDAARKTRDVASSQYKQAANRTVFFDPQMADGFLSNIHREFSLSKLPQDLSLTGNYPESEKMYNFIRNKFSPEIVVDPATGTPLNYSSNFPQMPHGPSLNARGIEEVRQNISSSYALASDKDKIGLDAIRRGFDSNLDQAIANKLFQGEGAEWLKEIKQARGSWSDYLGRFNSRNGPADSIFNNTLNKFRDPTTGKLSAQYDANAGAAAQGIINGKMIDPSVGPALHEKLQLTLGRNSPAMRAVDDHLKSALLGYEVNGNPNAKLLEKNITDMLTPRGRLLASKVFSNDELNKLAVTQKALQTINASPLPDATKNARIAELMTKLANSAFTKAAATAVGAVTGGVSGGFGGYGLAKTLEGAINAFKSSTSNAVKRELAGAPKIRPRSKFVAPPVNLPAFIPDNENRANGGRI